MNNNEKRKISKIKAKKRSFKSKSINEIYITL